MLWIPVQPSQLCSASRGRCQIPLDCGGGRVHSAGTAWPALLSGPPASWLGLGVVAGLNSAFSASGEGLHSAAEEAFIS